MTNVNQVISRTALLRTMQESFGARMRAARWLRAPGSLGCGLHSAAGTGFRNHSRTPAD